MNWTLRACNGRWKDEEFVLHHQPKVGIVSGKLTGAEAVIR